MGSGIENSGKSDRRTKRGSRSKVSDYREDVGYQEVRKLSSTFEPGEEPKIRISFRGMRGGRGGRYRGTRGGARRRRGGSGSNPSDPSQGGRGGEEGEKADEEDFAEEHVILRAPPALAEDIRDMIRDKERVQNLSLTFTEPKRALFKILDQEIPAKLVELPTIIESQKFFNKKQMVKIADISQMLVLEDPANQPSRQNKQRDPFIWPDGLTPPMKDVRRRRFRKRVSKQIIEIVENELERLLLKDLQAQEVIYEYADAPDREDSDSDGEINTQDLNADGSTGQTGTGGAGEADDNITEADLEMGSDNEFLDLDELEKAVEARDPNDPKPPVNGEGDEEDEEEEEEDEDDEDEDDEDVDDSDDSDSGLDEETMETKAMLIETIAEMETNLEKKRAELASATNPIIKKRFGDVVSTLELELEHKKEMLESLNKPPPSP